MAYGWGPCLRVGQVWPLAWAKLALAESLGAETEGTPRAAEGSQCGLMALTFSRSQVFHLGCQAHLRARQMRVPC